MLTDNNKRDEIMPYYTLTIVYVKEKEKRGRGEKARGERDEREERGERESTSCMWDKKGDDLARICKMRLPTGELCVLGSYCSDTI